jgi:hypothetical protein
VARGRGFFVVVVIERRVGPDLRAIGMAPRRVAIQIAASYCRDGRDHRVEVIAIVRVARFGELQL